MISSNDGITQRGDRIPWAGIAAISALAVAMVGLQMTRDRWFPPAASAGETLYVRSPAVVTRAALSFDAIASDVYWVRAIQYYGRIRLLRSAAARYDLLYPLLDLTTSLDPQFAIAYRFGAFFLTEAPPGGAGRPDLAIRLLEKAMAANPGRWEYLHDVGFVHYRRGKYAEAAAWFRRAAALPGAASWLAPFAAVTLATGGDLRASRVMWQDILSTSDEPWLRNTAAHRLRQLDAVEEVTRLARLTAEYERRHGDPPPTWDALVSDGALDGVPHDPAGHPYQLNPWWGFVTVARDSPMWPLPVDNPR